METVVVEKLIHGGQGLGTLANGQKVLLWNALPGETVQVELRKNKRHYAEGLAVEIIGSPAAEREVPRDNAYLSTSPWQIMSFAAENRFKQDILRETLQREKVVVNATIPMLTDGSCWEYRNKMEYSFWGDDHGLSLALYHRGTHGKQIVSGSSIARPEVDKTANKICSILEAAGIRAGQLKTIVVRCDQVGNTAAALFVKDQEFPKLEALANVCRGVAVYFSNPKSPASVRSADLYSYGDTVLEDRILGARIRYDATSFFQVNVPVFEMAVRRIQQFVKDIDKRIDLYSGVGTIGLAIGASELIESDPANIVMARHNIAVRPEPPEIVAVPAEQALDYIVSDAALIVDPPRAGLHDRVVECLLTVRPPAVAYLSCNPATLARDLARLQQAYQVERIEGYNFFPRTPHIEALALLSQR